MNHRRKPLPEVDDVFESVEINDKTDPKESSECFFLSVLKPEEVLIKTENLSQSPPYQCQKNYIPKNELSLLLKIPPDQINHKEENTTEPPNQSTMLHVLSKWLLGPKKEPVRDPKTQSSKGENMVWAWSEGFDFGID